MGTLTTLIFLCCCIGYTVGELATPEIQMTLWRTGGPRYELGDSIQVFCNHSAVGQFEFVLMCPTSENRSQDASQLSLSFDADIALQGQTCQCQVNPSSDDETSLTTPAFDITCPPPTPPQMSVNNGTTTISATDGETLDVNAGQLLVECGLLQGLPVDKNVTIDCGGTTLTEVQPRSLASLILITQTQDEVTCVCSAQHESDCYNIATSIYLQPNYGPTQLNTGPDGFDLFPVCPGRNPEFHMNCDVEKEVYPQSIAYVEGLTSENLSPWAVQTDLADIIRYKFKFTPEVTGRLPARCVAFNPVFPSIAAEAHFELLVSEPPPAAPRMSVVDDDSTHIMSDGETFNVRAPTTLTIICAVDGGFPVEKNISVNCGGAVSGETMASSTSFSLQINKSPDEVTCVCSADHISGCYTQTTSFTIQAVYGPTQLTTGPSGFDTFYMCPSQGPEFHMYCDVEKEVYPQPTVLLRNLTANDLTPWEVSTNLSDVIRYRFKFTPDQSGTKLASCSAVNPVFDDLRYENIFQLNFYEPPPDAPQITVDNGTSSVSVSDGDRLDFKTGDELTVRCVVDGGFPEDKSVAIDCGGTSLSRRTSASVSYHFEVMQTPHPLTCVCSAQHISGCYDKTTSFTIQANYGPTQMITDPYGSEHFPMCPGEDTEFHIQCNVEKDAHPQPIALLQGLTSNDLSPWKVSTDLPDVIKYWFKVTPKESGMKQAICVTFNPTFPDLRQEQYIDLLFSEPPPEAPRVSVIYGASTFVLSDGDKFNVEAVTVLPITCEVDGGYPTEKEVTVNCGGSIYTMSMATQVSFSLQINKSQDEVTCVCFAQHASGCYDQTTSFTIQANYGPTQLTTVPNGVDQFMLCPDKDPYFQAYCDVEKEVYPDPEVRIQGVSSRQLTPWTVNTNLPDVIRYRFKVIPEPGRKQVTCVAFNPNFQGLRVEKNFELFVYDPPSHAPRITVDSESASSIMTEGQALTVSLNQSLHVSCEVNGGHPAVSNVTLTCGSTTNVTGGTEASIRILVDKNTHQTVCKCSASHLSNCYDKTTEFQLDVWYPTVFLQFTANSETERLDIVAGEPVHIVCEAEGIPKPDLVVTGVYSGQDLHGQMISYNHYSNKFQMTRPIGCNESDTYVCKSRNGVSTQRELKVLVTCPPELQRIPNDVQFFSMSGEGLFKTKFSIFCRPPPTDVKLFKMLPAKDETAASRVDPGHFMANFEQLNDHEGQLHVDGFEIGSSEQTEYRLDVYNGVGMALQIPFVVNRTSDEEASEKGIDNKTVVLIVPLVILGVGLILFAVMLCCLWIQAKKYRKSKQKRGGMGIKRQQQGLALVAR